MKSKQFLFPFIALILMASLMTGCGSTASSDDDDAITNAGVASDYGSLVYVMYADAITATETLRDAIYTFVDNPTQENFDAAKEAWLDARTYYSQTEGFRFYAGPIDAADGGNSSIELRINSWPLDEVYIDYTSSDSDAGIINDETNYATINATVLKNINQTGGETNISTGYHAIEFLLWGQDLSTSTGGQRPYTDYLTSGGTASNQARRGAFLKAAVDLLLEDLETVQAEWAPNNNSNYRGVWNTTDPTTTLGRMMNGIGVLAQGELHNERIGSALELKEQEEEQSCFSDNTRNDIIDNIKSVQNVYLGQFSRLGGGTFTVRSLYQLGLTVNPVLANQIKQDIEDALVAAEAINDPFDQEFLDTNPAGRTRLENLQSVLFDLGANINTLSLALTGQGLVGDGD